VLAHLVARPGAWVDTAQLARATGLAPTVIRGLEAALRGLVAWRHDGRRILLMADTPALVAQALAEMGEHRAKLEQLAGVPLSDPEFAKRLFPALLDQQRVTWEFDEQFAACVGRAVHIDLCSRRLRAHVTKR
jgi:alkanesulfonate monooxygenase SsuD/methylene tetrahydromethanopterin reductase-like flavin-dependent oxidoreductase (luciferase family)